MTRDDAGRHTRKRPCPRCGQVVETDDDRRAWRVARATHWEPEEWEDGCVQCAPRAATAGGVD